ncbi:glycoside hydrolase domain-containing protein [Microbacterium marinilacus]|uniref:CBM6 domain-containing protein n=1 Tax=Microbacterium marinilacus TaxID=415209 RepID=A0ABP7BG74_9MICO|nr:glycoside hydrolase domain-containing protein [Microbacterium marinilacus]MBY0690128.1 glycoside hydrolase family 92 protein [Microbacterium marinilacus]
MSLLRTRPVRLLAGGVIAALLGSGLVPTAALAAEPAAPAAAATDFTALVNSFVSTEDDFGQDLPGAEAPNSIVKINPMTTPDRSHSGYDYAEDQIAGFTHTNLDGVGGSGGGGDLLVVPTYETYTSRPNTGTYAKTYSHDAEEAEPGYYGVDLQTTAGAIHAEATTDVRTGQDRFTFPQAGTASLVVDLRNNFTSRKGATLDYATLPDGRIALSGDFTGHFNGYDYKMYYYVESTAAASAVRTWGGSGALGSSSHQDGTDIGAVLDFSVDSGDQVGLKVAISPISPAQAKTDLAAEMGDRTFEQVREQTKADWNEILGRLEVSASATSDPDGDLQTLFYTHLYRMFGMPMNATSTSGTYRGLDGEIYEADGYTHYDGWGFWDDFRKYEILAIGYPEVFRDIAQSIVDLYASFAKSGKGALSNTVHSVPTVRFERAAVVVADAVAKGAELRGLAEAWPALVSQSQGGYADAANVGRGYIAGEVDDTLGTAYDDWAMATIADALGRSDDADAYRLRAANWKNLYKKDAVTLADGTKTGLIFPKDANGSWVNADPERFEAGNVYQGTLWQYHWYAADDMGGLIDLMGGEETTLKALSFMFGEHAPDDGRRMLHANANEIDLQAPYLFNYVGAPSKTQHWVRSIYTKETWNRYIATGSTHESPSGGGEFTPPIKTKVFKNDPRGFLPTMDNDTGTMSSTFVAAAIGLFPVLAGSDEYQIGTPFFENVRIRYESGRTFDISADGVSPDDYYIQSATLNGQPFERTWLTYDQLTAGGRLAFEMAAEPSDWAADGVSSSSLSDVLPTSVYDPTGAIVLSGRAFTEADAGDGSIGNEIELTLANGAFAGRNGDDLAASGAITAENMPAGLTLTATRTGDRAVTLSLTGKADRSGSLDSIDDLLLRLDDGAFSRRPSTGAREFALKVTFGGVTLRAERTQLRSEPDGSVDASVALTLSGASFAGAAGRDLVADGTLTLPGLPSGISATAVTRDATILDLRLTGTLGDTQRATFALAFSDAALTGAVASELRGDGISGLGTLALVLDRQWRSKLLALLEDADLVVKGAYTASSFAAFSAARDEARAVLADDDATDDELQSALNRLTRAAQALRIADRSDRLLLDGTTYGEIVFDDDFSEDRLSEYEVFGDGAEASAALSVDTEEGVLEATADGRRWSHIALPVEAGDGFALVVEPRGFAGSGASEDSLFIGLTDGARNRAHSWFNNTRSEGGFDVVVDGQGRDLGAGTAQGVDWDADDRFATVVDDGRITSWIEEDGTWRKIRSASLAGALTEEQAAGWSPTFSLRLDPGTIQIDRVTLLAPDETAVSPVRVQAEDSTSWSGGTLSKEGTSPSGNIGGTYDGAELSYADIDFGRGELTTLAVRTSTRDDRVGADPRLELYLDEKTEENRVATVALPKTGGWGNYVTTTVELERAVTGRHTLIVAMRTEDAGNGYNYVSNLDWYEFAPDPVETPPVDVAALKAAVAEAQLIAEHEDRYISIDFAVFRAALDEAIRVAAASGVTQDEVDRALRVLTSASDQLEWKVIRQLPGLIAAAEAVDPAAWTDESLAVLTTALEGARAVEEGASYETYAQAVDSLVAALDGLVPAEEPGTEEPGTEEPGTEEPGREEPGAEEPGTDEPGTEEPGTDEPGAEEPGTDEPGVDEPGADGPGAEEPGADPGADDPGTGPGEEGPGTDQPGTDPGAEPGAGEPGTEQPSRPGDEDPSTEQPGGETPAGTGTDDGPRDARPSFTPDPPVADGADLPAALRDAIGATVRGDDLLLSRLAPGGWHYVYAYSEPTGLGWVQADGEGLASTALPAGLEPGVHRIAVLDADGDLIGWTEVTVGAGGLAATGSDGAAVWGAGALAVLLLVAGGALLVARRRGRVTR